MLEVFGKAYSAPRGEKRELWTSILFGVFVGGFLVIFEPFDLHDAPYPFRPYSIAFFGVLSTLGLLFMFCLMPKIFPRFFDDQSWKVWHQIVLLLITWLLIATLNGVYINFLGDLDFSWSNYRWMMSRTFAVAIIPSIIIVLWDYSQKLSKHIALAETISSDTVKKSSVPKSEVITLYDSSQPVSIVEQEVLYMEAEGNYINVFLVTEAGVTHKMIRTSLTKTEALIKSLHIVRSHRSYIVNLSKVIEVSGNAQGLKLSLDQGDVQIPVSRKYMPVIKAFLGP